MNQKKRAVILSNSSITLYKNSAPYKTSLSESKVNQDNILNSTPNIDSKISQKHHNQMNKNNRIEKRNKKKQTSFKKNQFDQNEEREFEIIKPMKFKNTVQIAKNKIIDRLKMVKDRKLNEKKSSFGCGNRKYHQYAHLLHNQPVNKKIKKIPTYALYPIQKEYDINLLTPKKMRGKIKEPAYSEKKEDRICFSQSNMHRLPYRFHL